MRKEIKPIRIVSWVLLALAFISIVAILSSCSGHRQIFDATYTFDSAIIAMPDGSVVKGEIDSWRDFEDGDQLQIVINGVTYLTHASNVVMIKGQR